MVNISEVEIRDKFWEEYDKLSTQERLNYVWDNFGDIIMDVVRDWEVETLEEEIRRIKK